MNVYRKLCSGCLWLNGIQEDTGNYQKLLRRNEEKIKFAEMLVQVELTAV